MNKFLAIKENADFLLEHYKNKKSRNSNCLVVCPQCKKEFSIEKIKIQRAFKAKKSQEYFCCSKACATKTRETSRVYGTCGHCKKNVVRAGKDFRKSKSGLIFCNHSCAAKYNNQHVVKECTKMRKSKAEGYLINLIQDEFKELEVIPNKRNLLEDGLELDIYIPLINLAIELNGPTHYFPIYGEEMFKKIQNRDLRKQVLTQQKGINLIVLNTSEIKSSKKVEIFLDKEFDKIKDIIYSYL